MGVFQLQFVNIVGKSCRTEEGIARTHRRLEGANLTLDEGTDAVYLGLEMTHIGFVNVLTSHVDDVTLLLHNLTFHFSLLLFHFHLNRRLCHLDGIARRVEAEHTIGGRVVLRMVVAEEDDVETVHLFRNLTGSILVVLGSHDTTVPTTMKETYDDVGLLLFLQQLHPFAGTANHFLKPHTTPHRLMKPVGNGRCQHA